jgi:hypothetical protein
MRGALEEDLKYAQKKVGESQKKGLKKENFFLYKFFG